MNAKGKAAPDTDSMVAPYAISCMECGSRVRFDGAEVAAMLFDTTTGEVEGVMRDGVTFTGAQLPHDPKCPTLLVTAAAAGGVQ